MVTIPTLVKVFNILLHALHMDTGLYSLHSLQRGGATTAYRGGTDLIDIKRHGLWSSHTFWLYVTSPCVAASMVAASLADTIDYPPQLSMELTPKNIEQCQTVLLPIGQCILTSVIAKLMDQCQTVADSPRSVLPHQCNTQTNGSMS